MRTLLFAAAAVTMLVAAAPASAQMIGGADVQQTPGFILVQNGNNGGGSDYGPMGQCFDPRVCGQGRDARASVQACHTVRERVVTESGRVIFKRHRLCT